MKKSKITIGLAMFFVVVSFAASINAQTKSCPLDLNVLDYKEGTEAPEFPVENARATATNTTTKRVTRAALFEGMPRFAKLREGKYTITVTKAGYKRSIKQITIDCSGLDEDGSVTETIYLQKGSAKQTAKASINETRSYDVVRKGVIFMKGETINSTSTPLPNTQANKPEEEPPMELTKPSPSLVPGHVPSGGVLNSKARNLVVPEYPPAAKAVKASGTVIVQVIVDEQGNVVAATATSGHPLLRAAAVQAARESKFRPTLLDGQPVKVTGVIVYNFNP